MQWIARAVHPSRPARMSLASPYHVLQTAPSRRPSRQHRRSVPDVSPESSRIRRPPLSPALRRASHLRSLSNKLVASHAPSVEPDLFRNIVGSFPTGVTIVTTAGEDGLPHGLTSNAFASVSIDPPLLLVCVDKRSQTLESLRWSGAFVVNFLAASRDDLSTRFASKVEDKFSGVSWSPSELARGAPVLHQDSIAYAECVTTQEVEAGDHIILIGQVVGGMARGGTPLMYYRRSYGAWPESA